MLDVACPEGSTEFQKDAANRGLNTVAASQGAPPLPPPTDLFLQVFDLPPLDLRLVLQVADPLQRLKVRERRTKKKKLQEFFISPIELPHSHTHQTDPWTAAAPWSHDGSCDQGAAAVVPPSRFQHSSEGFSVELFSSSEPRHILQRRSADLRRDLLTS